MISIFLDMFSLKTFRAIAAAMLIGLAGCASTPPGTYSGTSDDDDTVPRIASGEGLEQRLYQQYQAWKGVRYREGGQSRQGIDCSGFVQLTYMQQLGLQLPRTTSGQAAIGEQVTRDQLETGDLVFFKTGAAKQHVGIYLDDGLFLHASTSKGVTISRLANSYWRARFWRANRVLN